MPRSAAPSGCTFCGIVAGDLPAAVVLDEPELMAFLDVRPVFKGHVLLVPRTHVVTLPELPAALRDPFLEAAQRLAQAVVDGLAEDRFLLLPHPEVGTYWAQKAADPERWLAGVRKLVRRTVS